MPSFITDPIKFRKFNGWATIFWILAAPLIVAFLSKSVPFLVLISVYAVITGHLATWQSARVEVNQEQQNDTDFEKIEKKVDEVHDAVQCDGE